MADFKKYIVLITGNIIMGLGIGLCDYSMLGTDPMTVLITGLLKHVSISFGTVNLIVSFLLILIGYLIEKRNVSLATFIGAAAVSIGIDLFGMIYLPVSEGLLGYVYLLIGITLYCLGIALSQIPRTGYTAYDCTVFAIMKIIDKEYHIARWIVDFSFIISGYLLGGEIGLGTIVILLVCGKLIMFFVKVLEKIIRF
ncbi:MAG: hypothetical protein Q4D13_08145 [Erysipelotrichaceae bacterium]|nr:hypothetical protein [Erysipelotrichaceae bacterium]